MSEKILTITVPSYNVEKYLNETIPHFLDERILDDIEVLIVNDGSKDSTQKIACEFETKYPDTVRAIEKPNGGHGSTINRGIKEAKGKYFKVVDGDDWVDTEEFVKFVEKLKTEDSDIILTPFKRVFIDVNREEDALIKDLVPEKQYKFDEITDVLGISFQMHSITFKTSILKKIPSIRENSFYVDQEYNIYPIPYVNTVTAYSFNVYRYRLGSTEQSMNVKNMQKNRKMHENVTMDLLNYYLDIKGKNPAKDILVKRRVAGMCERQIRIWLSMDVSEETKDDLNKFLKTVKSKSDEIYKSIPGKKALLLRIFGIKAYKLTSKIQHKSDSKG